LCFFSHSAGLPQKPAHSIGRVKIERDAQCGEGWKDARRPPWWHGQTAPNSPSPSQGARSIVQQPRLTGPGRPQGSLNPARARVELGPWSPSARACPVPKPAAYGSVFVNFRSSLLDQGLGRPSRRPRGLVATSRHGPPVLAGRTGSRRPPVACEAHRPRKGGSSRLPFSLFLSLSLSLSVSLPLFRLGRHRDLTGGYPLVPPAVNSLSFNRFRPISDWTPSPSLSLFGHSRCR
jgi:hypothetical protein